MGGKGGKKNRKGFRQDDLGSNDLDVDMGGQQQQRSQQGQQQKVLHRKGGKKQEKANKAKQDRANFHLRKGILNAVTVAENDVDGDLNMGEANGGGGGGGNQPRIKKKGKALLKNLLIHASKSDSAVGWHKITLEEGARHPKDLLLQALAANMPENTPLVPICFEVHKAKRSLTFYVERPAAATALKAQHQRPLTLANGQVVKMTIKSASSPPPQMTINENVLAIIKRVMGGASRFRPEVKALDMKAFHSDAAFVGEAVYAPLARSSVMSNVVEIIGDNIPDVEAIDFSGNKLPTLEHFSTLADRADRLKVLYLSDNRLSDVKELEKIRSLRGLVELNLSGNPGMEKKFNSRAGFVQAVQTILPSLQILDGQQLKKLITFDDDDGPEAEVVQLPLTVKKMCGNPEVEPVILQFIQQYFKAYDLDDRSGLAAAYHPEALFSVSAAYPPGSTSHGTAKLTDYQNEARNLLRVTSPAKRLRLLRQGRQDIVSFLGYELPKTRHDLDSFTLDVPFATPAMMTFTVSGVFVERTSQKDIAGAVRHFNRCFTLVPCGSGVVIANETLLVTIATKLQAKTAFQPAAAAAAPPPSSAALAAAGPGVSSPNMDQMVQEVVGKTGMKREWAQRCLEQTQWNLNQAIQAFNQAKAEGRIPSDAYQ